MDQLEFTIKLADTVIAVRPLYGFAREYCRDYLCDGPAAFTVTVTLEDLETERKFLALEARQTGYPLPVLSQEELDTVVIHRKIALELLDRGMLVFHGSCISVDGEAYLFAAPSGTGKSTHARLWRQCFGSRAQMVNDDKPLLHITGEGVFACGSPWCGKHSIGNPIIRPLKAICLLERGEENRIRPISFQEGYTGLLQQLFWPPDPADLSKTLTLLDRMMVQVPLYRLECNMDPEAAKVSHRGMNGGTTV